MGIDDKIQNHHRQVMDLVKSVTTLEEWLLYFNASVTGLLVQRSFLLCLPIMLLL